MLELAVTRVQLGFRTFAVFRSFTAVPRNLNLRVLSSLRTQAMGSGRKGKKASASENIDLKSDNDVAEENGVRNKVPGILGIERDPSKLERMTVTELRAALRDVGASTKGPKHQLVSALKTILCNEIDGKHSPAADELSSKIETLPAQESVERANASSEASRRWQKRKSKHVDGEEYVVSDNVVQVEQQVLKESGMTSGKKRITKRKIIAETSKRSVGVSEGIEEPVFESEPWTTFAHKKPQKGWIAYNPRTMRPPPLTPNSKFLKLMSWNVNGLRALLKMEGFSALQLAQREDFDILCLQETKLQEKDVESMRDLLEGYENSFWTCSVSKPGYSGTTIISRIKPLSVKYGLGISDHDTEGRLVTAEFDSFYLLCAYVPNSGDGLKRLSYRISQWDPSLSSYMQELEKSKPVILTGDLNCAHQEIDIYNPAGNRRSAGFTDEERQSFEMNFLAKGYVDTFRKQHPHAVGYTYWGYRHGARKTNRGWRLDYFLVSELIAENVHDSYILPDVTGSDHCPIGLVLKY